jgi:hypothetical protein
MASSLYRALTLPNLQFVSHISCMSFPIAQQHQSTWNAPTEKFWTQFSAHCIHIYFMLPTNPVQWIQTQIRKLTNQVPTLETQLHVTDDFLASSWYLQWMVNTTYYSKNHMKRNIRCWKITSAWHTYMPQNQRKCYAEIHFLLIIDFWSAS